jgi:hypothetical protein
MTGEPAVYTTVPRHALRRLGPIANTLRWLTAGHGPHPTVARLGSNGHLITLSPEFVFPTPVALVAARSCRSGALAEPVACGIQFPK